MSNTLSHLAHTARTRILDIYKLHNYTIEERARRVKWLLTGDRFCCIQRYREASSLRSFVGLVQC